MTWLVDGQTFARKVKNPTYGVRVHDRRGRSIECPSCGFVLDQSNLSPEWPGLPAGVKFDPSDQELLEHLAAKVELDGAKIHPFINDFIPTLDEEDGICYTHPENLPGVRHDGSSIHLFHMPAKAYTTGTRKRRKVHSGEEIGNGLEMRWHKTGKTRPVIDNGKQVGCKKIMVLYVSLGKKTKAEKTNWVMHQYHLGVQEEEKEGEFVVSKVFYQTQPRQCGVGRGDDSECVAVEVAEQQAYSYHHSNTSNFSNSNSSLATPSTPKALGPFQGQPAKQHKGLLATITEDVERLKASLSAHSQNTIQSSDQSNLALGYDSIALDYKSASKIQRSANYAAEGSSELGEMDTCCSLERREFEKELECELRAAPIEPSADMPSFEGHHISLDSEMLKILSNENLDMNLRLQRNHDVVTESLNKGAQEGGGRLDPKTGNKSVHKADIGLENIILDTPPDFLLESFMNSQETADWLGKRKFWSDSSQKTDDGTFLDFIRDSQSSV
eukprot:c18028_g4_i1 orf=103-1599(-)